MVASVCGLFHFIAEDSVQLANFTSQVLSLASTSATLFCLLFFIPAFQPVTYPSSVFLTDEKVGMDALFVEVPDIKLCIFGFNDVCCLSGFGRSQSWILSF